MILHRSWTRFAHRRLPRRRRPITRTWGTPGTILVFALCIVADVAGQAGTPRHETARHDAGSVRDSAAAVVVLTRYLEKAPDLRPPLARQPFVDVALTRSDAVRVKDLLWVDHVARIRATRAAEMKARQLTHDSLTMPFYYKVFGDKPKHGRAMYISMHGGGGAPKRVNDSQWENQKRLYRLDEGVYVVPRAPTNTWNLWHQAHIDWFFSRLIEDLIVFEDVDPNRVYLMGYSAGGDGVFQLAPRMADRFAAAAMMAGHPNETSPLGLRNLPFTIHVGGRDAAYHRNEIARRWADKLDELYAADPGGYVHWVKIYPDKAHWLDHEDAAAIPWMAKYQRQLLPTKIVWKQDDVKHDRFYWLAVDPAVIENRAEVVAKRDGQTIDVAATGVPRLTILLRDELLDLDQPVTVTSAGTELFAGRVSRSITVIARTLAQRGDPSDVYCAERTVQFPAKKK